MDEDFNYDKYVDFYYSNLINSLVLLSLSARELEKLASPSFDPIDELYEEAQYAFTPVCFETIFRTNKVDPSFKDSLLKIKIELDAIPSEIWNYENMDNHEAWISTRKNANALLGKLGISHRKYTTDFITVYDKNGKGIDNLF